MPEEIVREAYRRGTLAYRRFVPALGASAAGGGPVIGSITGDLFLASPDVAGEYHRVYLIRNEAGYVELQVDNDPTTTPT